MIRSGAWILAPLLFAVTGCLGQIPVVGLDEDGKLIESMVKKNDYVNHLTSSVNDLQDSVVPALDSDEARGVTALRQAQLGLGLTGSVGLGDYFKLGGNIGFRLVFANQ